MQPVADGLFIAVIISLDSIIYKKESNASEIMLLILAALVIVCCCVNNRKKIKKFFLLLRDVERPSTCMHPLVIWLLYNSACHVKSFILIAVYVYDRSYLNCTFGALDNLSTFTSYSPATDGTLMPQLAMKLQFFWVFASFLLSSSDLNTNKQCLFQRLSRVKNGYEE